jgi:transcriptional regulator with XRE-family HTH domain
MRMDKRGKAKWRRVGEELTALRERKGLKQAQLAPDINVVPAHISAWEHGKRGMTEDQALRLDQALDANGRFHRVWKNANAPKQLPEWYDRVPDMERKVSELREYQCLLFPGLIQTPDYARVAIQDSLPWCAPSEVTRMVESRMQRQEILYKEHPPLVSMVVEASVLSRVMGERHIQVGQLDSLLTLVEEGRLRFQSMPPEPQRHPGSGGPFRIYTFPGAPALASAEYAGGEVLMEDLEEIQQRMTIFGFLQADALSLDATVELVRTIRKSFDE